MKKPSFILFILLCSVATAAGPIINPYRFAAAPALPWAHVQSTGSQNAAGSTTIGQTYSSNVATGSLLVCAVSWFSLGGEAVSGVADSLGQTWTQAGTSLAEGSNFFSLAVFYFPNSSAGANTVTVTFSTSSQFRRISISEYSGIKTTSPLDQTAQQTQVTPSAAADGVTSGNITTTTANELIYAACLDRWANAPQVAGTGFTARNSQYDGTYCTQVIEDKNLAAPGVTAGTFTAIPPAGDNTATIVVAFKQP